MIRLLGRIWARISYLFTLEVEAAKNEINAATAKVNAAEKRKLVEQLTAEADAIEANIKTVEVEEETRKSAPEYQNLSKQEQYEDERESKKERDAALQMVAEKRKLVEQETENVTNAENVARVLKGRAQDSRAFADKIRQI